MPYPVALFCYNRLDCLEQTISALQENALAKETDVIVFCDGPKNTKDLENVNNVRIYLKSFNNKGFKSFRTIESTKNKGLADSIIGGVSEILKTYEATIVLEDDLITSSNFLKFMNQALEYYQNNEKIMSVSGYTSPMKKPQDYPYDVYFIKRASSWGWATWKNKWNSIDWEVSDYESFVNDKEKRNRFNRMGSDMSSMLNKQMQGKINSWAIRWCYHQFKNDLYSVSPLISKISNIGFGSEASNTKGTGSRFVTELDQSAKENFNFSPKPMLIDSFTQQFVAVYSIKMRIFSKLNFLDAFSTPNT